LVSFDQICRIIKLVLGIINLVFGSEVGQKYSNFRNSVLNYQNLENSSENKKAYLAGCCTQVNLKSSNIPTDAIKQIAGTYDRSPLNVMYYER
jgi:hypothetical protein